MNSGGDYRLGGYRELGVPSSLQDRLVAAWTYSEAESPTPAGPAFALRIIPRRASARALRAD